MAAGKFNDPLEVVGAVVHGEGPLTLDGGEDPLVMCVKILQGDRLLAECDSQRHPVDFPSGRWHMPADVAEGLTPREGAALGVAVLVTQGPRPGEMNTYQWIQPLSLKV
jgi:hypothetical protein